MLSEILVAVVVVAVFFLVGRDATKRTGEILYPDVDGYGYQTRPGAAGASRGRVPEMFSDPGGPGSGPLAGEAAQPSVGSPKADATAHRQTGNRHVRSRLLLLAAVPALAVAIIALCVAYIANSSSHDSNSPLSVLALGIVAVVVLLAAIWITVAMARSVLRPLYRLRAQALDAASGRYPAAETAARDHASDEIGDIARAFDQMSGEMSRLAGHETNLRGKLDAMLVNLSHRGQSLAERQMRLLDNLQRGERDRERLASLIRVNRLSARIHRNSRNLLVLASHEVAGGWNQPLALADMVRAAVSEIEEHERISLSGQPDIAVTAPAVADMINILAELIQNATAFSSADMPVEVSSRVLNEGGVLIAVTDRGVGMTAKELTYANWQLEHPPGADIDVPKSVGLIVVARLAARHGARTRLQQAEFGGLTALLWLPEELITRQSVAMPLRPGGAGLAGSTHGAHETADSAGTFASRQADFAAPADDFAVGRRLVSEAGRRPGPAWTALGSRHAQGASSGGQDQSGQGKFGQQGQLAQEDQFGQQDQFGQPGQLVQQDQSSQQDQFARPGQPAQYGQSGQFGQQGQFVQPGQLEQRQPAQPGQFVQPGQLEQRQPGRHGQFGQSGLGGTETGTAVSEPFRPQLPGPGRMASPGGVTLPGDYGTAGRESGPPRGGVIVPSVEPPEDLRRLPIFDSVESSWFSAARPAEASPDSATVPGNQWSSPGDEGWRAAESVETPASGEPTSAGLPKRTPNANLVPGAVRGAEPPEMPTRSPAAVRDRLARFQRGVNEGRTAASETNPAQDEQS